MSAGQPPDDALALGGVLEETLELLRVGFETDEFYRQHLRNQARLITVLEQVARNTGSLPEGPFTPPGNGDSGSGSDDDTPREPTYHVTEESIDVTSSEWEKEEFGFVARTVVLIFDNQLTVAYANPDDNDNVELTLDPDKSPFTLSGVDGIFTPRVYYKQGADASETPVLDVIALK